ncbi:MAG: BrnT family toxin [Lachnospiraceae bacterium]|nr:BrnT family toxin [Lachnospiraceae bacterium]
MLLFDWDANKNRINKQKHGIDFIEASTVFFDKQAILFDDPEHSEDEDRFILLGMSESSNICIVCHCYREDDTVIRIISARKATKREEEAYVKGI